MLIPGPTGPGDAIDTYLQPLIEEFKELWDVGVETYDASAKQNFKLHASLLWTINDFPAYGNLSGWSTKGKLACPCCNKDTSSTRLTNCKKQCFMGHHRYLPHNHKWRNEKESFDGTYETRPPTKVHSGTEILNQVEDLEGLQLSKDPKKRKKISHENRKDNWNKKELNIDNLEQIEAQIPITLCKLEKVFPPSFFDVMVHLPIHLATEAKIAGPIHYRWMYPVERWLYFLKSLIGNRACPEGCIAEGYIAHECMTLCSRYLHRIETKFNQPERNYDGGQKQSTGGLSMFCQPGKTLGAKPPFELEADELEQAHIYIIKNCDEVFPYLEFHVEDYDKKLRTQNCGVVIVGENGKDSDNLDYYGVLWIFLKTNEPFILADQASQVFYANNNSNKGWQVVRKTQPRDSFDIVELIDDDIAELGSPSQKKRKITNEVKIKMKSMKLENEVDSSILKSTIRYTFVAPGSIGKGRGQGQGLKSLGEKRHMTTKRLISDKSSDLVEHYIKEIETRKGRGQGLKNSTMYTSQGMETIHKKFIALEKENMQINTLTLASTHQVKQYTQKVEKTLNKSTIYANQKMQTPSKRTRINCTTSSSQQMQTIDRLVLQKEDMQTNGTLPPSTDQVMKHSQSAEKDSSNPRKDKRVRGSNKCKEVASLENGQKLKIVRDRNICPLGVSSWNDIKQEKLDHMWAAVENKFESVDMNDHRDHVLGWMNELWNKWRGYLHVKYVKDKPIQQSLKDIPKGVDKKEWEWLVKEHFAFESFHARNSRKATNRAKLKMLHHIGNKPIREIIYQQGRKDGNPPNLATIL
ncbi:hypothetical protein KY284_030118 [Solanum tuberosum]|nr:hypothetical protein KY284_030118 [Solanum tuberosum]